MSYDEVEYTEDIMDFPDADELRDLTTPKEEIFKAKKRSFIMNIGSDIVAKAKNQGEYSHSMALASNFLGLVGEDQDRMLKEVTDFLTKQGFQVSITENTNGTGMLTKTLTVSWSNQNESIN